jgi:hypothetical protein
MNSGKNLVPCSFCLLTFMDSCVHYNFCTFEVKYLELRFEFEDVQESNNPSENLICVEGDGVLFVVAAQLVVELRKLLF